MQLVNDRKGRQTNHTLGKNWEDHFVIVSSEEMTNIVTLFIANLDTGRLSNDL